MSSKTVKAFLFWGLAILILFVISPIAGAENLYGSVIRIHVIADSDSPQDQEQKLLVRDRIVEYAKEHFSKVENVDQAKKEIEKNQKEICQVAKSALQEVGCQDEVEVSLTREYYPTREYQSLFLPSGSYLSLQVKIGSASGRNWWCVLFPPMCLDSAVGKEDALLDVGMNKENVKTVTQNGTSYKVRFKILEIWSSAREKIQRIF